MQDFSRRVSDMTLLIYCDMSFVCSTRTQVLIDHNTISSIVQLVWGGYDL